MKPRKTSDRLRVLARALALADERRAISMEEAAEEAGVSVADLRALLDPVLFLEWRDAGGELLGETRAFLLTEDGFLTVTEEHWLRGLAASRPDAPTALRLFVAGVVLQAATSTSPSPALDRAVERLASILDAEVVVNVDRPQWAGLCEEAHRARRTLCVRYLNAIDGTPRDIEIEPHLVASQWANWYVLGRVLGHENIIALRIDRILEAELGDNAFELEDVKMPEWWDLTEHERTLIVRATPRDLDRLPQPNRSTIVRELEDGRVEAQVTVIGPRRLDHTLLALGPDAEVTWPEEYAARRRALAQELLAVYAD